MEDRQDAHIDVLANINLRGNSDADYDLERAIDTIHAEHGSYHFDSFDPFRYWEILDEARTR